MPEFNDETLKHDSGGSLETPTQKHAEEFAPGTVLANKYKVVSVLGKGGMGTVYRVEQVFLATELALKVLDVGGAFNDVQLRRFQTEGRTAFALTHPNLVKVHDFAVFDNGQPYLAMDYVPGKTLAELLKLHGSLTFEQIGRIFPQACFGIAYAHQNGVIHRDIKPSNIMLVDNVPLGEEGSVKIVDFGIAKVAAEEGGEMQALTRTGEIFGSPLYMSPEQCSGTAVDQRTDIYSLGCVLFEALTGTPPLVGNNALRTMMLHQTSAPPSLKEASMGKDFSPEMEGVVQKMLKKEPSDRYNNLGVVAHQIVEACSATPVAAGASSLGKSKVGGQDKSASRAKNKPAAARTKVSTPFLIAGAVAITLACGIAAAIYITNEKPEDAVQTSKRTKPSELDNLNDPFTSMAKQQKRDMEVFDSGSTSLTAINDQIRIYKSCADIKAKQQLHEGVMQKLFEFPECGMGQVSNRMQSEDTFEKTSYGKISARGKEFVPNNAPLTLEENVHKDRAVFAYPRIFEKIDPKEFNEILISTRMPSTLVSQTGDEYISFSTLKILNICSSWKNLQSVVLLDTPQSKELIEKLNEFQHLQRFHIASPSESNETAAESTSKGIRRNPDAELGSAEWTKFVICQPFVKRLEYLGLEEMQVNTILPSLASLPKLESLALIDTRVTPDSILSLNKFPHLKVLRFCEHNAASDAQIKALTQLQGLDAIYLKEMSLPAEQIKLLAATNPRTEIYLSSRSQMTFQELNIKDPRFKIANDQ